MKLRVKPIHQRKWGSGSTHSRMFIHHRAGFSSGIAKINSYPQTFIFDIHLRGLMLWFEFGDIHNVRAWFDNFVMVLRLGFVCNYWHFSMNLYIISEHLVLKLIRQCGGVFFFGQLMLNEYRPPCRVHIILTISIHFKNCIIK